MDIVKITMEGYGCNIARGTIKQKEYKHIKNSVDNVWHKNLYRKLKKESDIETYSEDYGIVNGDIRIVVNDNIIVDNQISIIEVLDTVNFEVGSVSYPETEDIVVTTVQHQEGTICETIFILDGTFSLNKLTVVKKDVVYNVDNPLTSSLYCELHYDGERLPLIDSETDLRGSRLYLETIKNYGKNKNR